MVNSEGHGFVLHSGETDDMCGGSPLIESVLFPLIFCLMLFSDVGEIHRRGDI